MTTLPWDELAHRRALARLDALTKPKGSLGKLEALAARLAGITGGPPRRFRRKVVVTFAADHGVAAEGVSAYPQAVTAQMVRNFLAGGAAINVLARAAGARVVVVDMGVAARLPAHAGLMREKVGWGTKNFSRQRAMTPREARQAVEAGKRVWRRLRRRGADLVAVGEMGIANSTSAAALVAALTGAPAGRVTGYGTGVSEQGRRAKAGVIRGALARWRPGRADPWAAMAAVGGFELAGMAGLMLAAARDRVPVVLDGFISGAAALWASRLAPDLPRGLIAGHRSAEPGHAIVLKTLGLDPLFDLSLRLGEGTGAALALPMIEASARLLHEMATFDGAGVSRSARKEA